MNIFVLDNDPVKAAQYHNDKHCSKMILETAQILCAAFPKGEAPYKRTHYNHPCSIWARTTRQNFEWLIALGIALEQEFQRRFSNTHKSLQVILWCAEHMDELTFPEEGLQPFAQAVPDHIRRDDAVEAYRELYRTEKRHMAVWKTETPWWFR